MELSKYEQSSVGRLYVNLVKVGRPKRWRRLLQQTDKLPNQSLWWELHDKYEEALLNHTQFETDESMEQFIHIDNSPPKNKKKSGKSKKTKAAASTTASSDDLRDEL